MLSALTVIGVAAGSGKSSAAWCPDDFGIYLVLWTVVVTAALANATGLGIAKLTGGRIFAIGMATMMTANQAFFIPGVRHALPYAEKRRDDRRPTSAV